ncbi:hypothetical protein EON83_14360 [bacterium]|nr:MAG: hypothetical protein EON83_14360 [bacterium]
MTEETTLPDEEAIISGLSERGLPIWGAAVVAPQIGALRPPLREAFLSWWQTGEVPDISVQGQSAQSLVDSGVHPLGALLSLDALERSPIPVMAGPEQHRERFIAVIFDETSTSGGNA